MEQIRAASQKVKEMIGGLPSPMTQQVGAVTDLSKALAKVSEMSQSISAATVEQTTNAKQVSKAVESVTRSPRVPPQPRSRCRRRRSSSSMAQELQKLMAQFKITDGASKDGPKPAGDLRPA